MTSRQQLLLASSAVFALALSPASAGPCTDQIAEIQKTLSSMDAGSGPTMRAGSAQEPSTTASAAPARTGGAAAPGTEATPAMSAAVEGRAASAQDVRAQQQGQPTSAQVAQGSGQAARGAQLPPDKLLQVNAALDRARSLDQQGNNDGCTQAINEARQLAGSR
jgi:hypothetical protein